MTGLLTLFFEPDAMATTDKYRGGVTYWKFNNEKGRIEPENSFTVEAPPYSQDLSDFGKLASSGWSFTNSFCSERYVGGIELMAASIIFYAHLRHTS